MINRKRTGVGTAAWTPQQQQALPSIPVVHKHPKYPKPGTMVATMDALETVFIRRMNGMTDRRMMRYEMFVALGQLFGETNK